MVDSSAPKKTGIPSWQQVGSTPSEQESESQALATKPFGEPKTIQDSTSTALQESTLEQIIRFLREEKIQNAPSEQKVAFLESKGIDRSYIDIALGMIDDQSRPSDGSASSETNLSLLSATSQANQSQAQAHLQPQATPLQQSQRDVPPIITYPEFLVHANKPPPLITFSRLLNTTYVASGIAAAIYGASKYLVAPMTESLTYSRHDFAEHTRTHMNEFNEKMSKLVSIDPEQSLPNKRLSVLVQGADNDLASDAGTAASDPTELFHRDYGTQTSLDLAESVPMLDDSTSSSDESLHSKTQEGDTIGVHAEKLKQLHKLFSDLSEESSSNACTAEDISVHINALKNYLEDLQYPGLSWNTGGLYGTAGTDGKKKDDEMDKVKKEIRNVKSFFLSARNFPATGRNSVGAYG